MNLTARFAHHRRGLFNYARNLRTTLRGVAFGFAGFVGLSQTGSLHAATISVYGSGGTNVDQNSSFIRRYSQSGDFEERLDLSGTAPGISLATDGSAILVGEKSGSIKKFDLHGVYLGELADLGSQAGATLFYQRIEVDADGSLYSAFLGVSGESRTSFRLEPDGNISATFFRPDLQFPRGIDGFADGDVYILDSSSERLFRFGFDGAFVADYLLPEAQHPSDVAINEMTRELFVADEFGAAILIYDLTTGVPVYRSRVAVPGFPQDVFIEPVTGRVFGVTLSLERKRAGRWTGFEAFEVSDQDASLLFFDEAGPSSMSSVIAIAIPEPHWDALMLPASVAVAASNRRLLGANRIKAPTRQWACVDLLSGSTSEPRVTKSPAGSAGVPSCHG